MNVGIAGAGAIGMGYAALLLQNGHSVCVWSPSGNRTVLLRKGQPIKVTGAIEGEFRPGYCESAQALADCDVLVLALPANGHKFVIDRLLPHLQARHTIIISGHLSFGALYASKLLAGKGLQIPLAAWNTTALTCKMQGPNTFRVGVLRSKIDIASIPKSLFDQSYQTCVELFGERFERKGDLLTIALSNLNPQNHLGMALCNLTRIELAEPWGQNSKLTASVGCFLEALDAERLSIARAFGKQVRTIFDHYRMSYGVTGDSVGSIAKLLLEKGNDPMGPSNLNTRYVTEDVPFGLVPTLFLAHLAGLETPLHESGLAIINACYRRDFKADNDLLPCLEITDPDVLRVLTADGYSLARSVS